MDLNDRKIGAAFGVWFVFCALIGLVMLGLCGWALVELVQWVTSK